MSREIEEQLEIFSSFLKKNGLNTTRQRELIVETFLRADGHLSADELFELVKKSDRKLGFATVFRTLKALTECGLARETDLSDGRTRFEHLYKRPHHHHIVCEECGRTIEFFSAELEEIQEDIVARYNFKPRGHKLQIFVVCADCQKRQEGEDPGQAATGPESHPTFENDLVFARDALKIAMETEKRGVSFYRTAADLASHPSTRKAFLAMLDEEQRHLDGLEEEWDRLIANDQAVIDAPVFLHFDFEALQRIFPSREEVHRRLNQNLNEREALELAMKMEREAHNFFAEYAERFNDTQGRDIFLKFAEEELEHYDTIKKELDDLGSADPVRDVESGKGSPSF